MRRKAVILPAIRSSHPFAAPKKIPHDQKHRAHGHPGPYPALLHGLQLLTLLRNGPRLRILADPASPV